MPGHTRLYRRGAVYYHRAAIPVDIKGTYPKSEETFSLKTKDYKEALRRVKVAAVEVDRKFDEHRRQLDLAGQAPVAELTDEQLKHYGELYYANLLWEDDERREEGFGDEPWPAVFIPSTMGIDEVNELVRLRAQSPDTFEEYVKSVEEWDEATKYQYPRGDTDPGWNSLAEETLMGWYGGPVINLKPGSPSRKKLIRLLQAATIKAHEVVRQRNQGDVVDTPEVDDQPQAPPSGPLLSSLVEPWLEAKVAAKEDIRQGTLDDGRIALERFITVAGDKPIGEYTKADGRHYHDVISKIPAKWTDKPELQGLDIVSAAKRAHELGMAPIVPKTRNKYINAINNLWKWAKIFYDECGASPLEGMRVQRMSNSREDRDPFKLDELQRIFIAPIYTGCRSAHFYSQPGDVILIDTAKYWVPLIALFTGARLNEICQLYVDGVGRVTESGVQSDGVLCFKFTPDHEGQRAKNPFSKRSVPIHQALLDMGLMDFVLAQKKQGESRLFPELQLNSRGYYSDGFSTFYGRFLKKTGVKTHKNAFHSFRHSFEDACRRSGVPQEHINVLLGHRMEGMAQRYGSEYPLGPLVEAIRRLRYDGLDLSHLYQGRVVSA